MRNLDEPVIRCGKRAQAEHEMRKLEPVARRMGYALEVRATARRYGRYVVAGAPWGVFLAQLGRA